MIEPADIQAASDVVQQVVEECEDTDFDRAVALRDALIHLRAQAAISLDMLEMEMVRQAESGAKEVNGVQYIAVNKYRDRVDHDAVEGAVVAAAKGLAVNRETGEIDPEEAARQAAHLMRTLYVSPSTTVKQRPLEKVGLELKEVRDRERIGRRLHIVDTT